MKLFQKEKRNTPSLDRSGNKTIRSSLLHGNWRRCSRIGSNNRESLDFESSSVDSNSLSLWTTMLHWTLAVDCLRMHDWLILNFTRPKRRRYWLPIVTKSVRLTVAAHSKTKQIYLRSDEYICICIYISMYMSRGNGCNTHNWTRKKWVGENETAVVCQSKRNDTGNETKVEEKKKHRTSEERNLSDIICFLRQSALYRHRHTYIYIYMHVYIYICIYKT